MERSGPIKIFLVDDHRLFRDGLRRLLVSDGRFEVVGEASSGEEFMEKVEGLGADLPLVFMDIDMPGMGGIEATRRAVDRWPGLRVVALSMHDQAEFYVPMMAAGAVDFLMKDSEFSEVVRVALAAAGRSEADPSCETARQSAAPLSDREAEVLTLICAGLSTQQIADRLFISKRTVDKHRANILEKTDCKNTASLVVYAMRNRLIMI